MCPSVIVVPPTGYGVEVEQCELTVIILDDAIFCLGGYLERWLHRDRNGHWQNAVSQRH